MAGAGGVSGTAVSGLLPTDPRRAQRGQTAREARAKEICATCTVRGACLEYAIRIREPHGIWGGLNEIERKQLGERSAEAGRRLRARGREPDRRRHDPGVSQTSVGRRPSPSRSRR